MSSQHHHLHRTFVQVPVTALALYTTLRNRRVVLAGEDNYLVARDDATGDVVARTQVFDEQQLHGVRVQGDGALIWGARDVAWLEIEEFLGCGEASSFVRARVADWIYDAAVLPDQTAAVLATAHNEIIPLSLSKSALSTHPAISPSRPILYAAHLCYESPDTVLFAGGTVFGEILVWRAHLGSATHDMLCVLSGHEGSIFGVHISDEMSLRDGRRGRLLASCSDDRTVRIWDINERGETVEEERFTAPLDTGFREVLEDKTSDSRVVAVAMGHLSRIWGVKFAIPEGAAPGEPLTVYSFGEDSTTQRWRLDLDAPPKGRNEPGTLTHQRTFALHDGKHLWSHVLTQQSGENLIVTGGADGKISLISDSPSSSTSTTKLPTQDLLSLDFDSIFATLSHAKQLIGKRETFTRYEFITQDEILVATSLGRLLLGTFGPGLIWREVNVSEEILSGLKYLYVMTRMATGLMVLGTTTGGVYAYTKDTGVTLVGTVPGKIINIFNLSITEAEDTSSVDLLVSLHGTPESHILTLDRTTGCLQTRGQVTGLDSRFVTSFAAKVGQDLLAIGSRHGYISLLRRQPDGYHAVFDMATRTHDAITGIIPLPVATGSSSASSQYFLATSRDGKYRIYEIKENQDRLDLRLHHESSPPLGPMIEGAGFTTDATPELVLFGFRSKDFIIWNESRREEIASVECGNAHRAFAVMRHPTVLNSLRFAYTKASKLYIYSQEKPVHRPLRQGIHGREVRALSSNGSLIATGSEDTTIRIWQFRETQGEKNRELSCVAYMKLHVTGLQRLKWAGEDYLFSSAGNEELFVWRVTKLDAAYLGLGVACEAVFDDKTRDGDLRIMDFDVHRTPSSGMIVTVAFSNSALKTYRYTLDKGFELLAQMSYTGACLTQARHLNVDETRASILTASTDGHLATWDVRLDRDTIENHVLVQVVPLHQNCIKSLDMQPRQGGYLVFTGGDDNGLGVASVTPLSDDAGTHRYTVSSRTILRRAHAAGINGVVLLDRGDQTLGISVSNDQRIKAWKIGTDELKLLSDRYSGVADSGEVEILDKTGSEIMVGGVGVEVWTI